MSAVPELRKSAGDAASAWGVGRVFVVCDTLKLEHAKIYKHAAKSRDTTAKLVPNTRGRENSV